MKTNLTSLMNLIDELEKKYLSITMNVRNHVFNEYAQELNGSMTVIQDSKDIFLSEIKEADSLMKEITHYKDVLYQKNNSLKLSDGRTIQTAIVENQQLRKLKSTYEDILRYRSSKSRITEVNNSYFQVRVANYNEEEIMNSLSDINNKIRNTDFEISKLNSEEFTI